MMAISQDSSTRRAVEASLALGEAPLALGETLRAFKGTSIKFSGVIMTPAGFGRLVPR